MYLLSVTKFVNIDGGIKSLWKVYDDRIMLLYTNDYRGGWRKDNRKLTWYFNNKKFVEIMNSPIHVTMPQKKTIDVLTEAEVFIELL